MNGQRSSVSGRTALITGAGNGIGRAIALEVASRGVRVVLTGRNIDKLSAVQDEIKSDVRIAVCDVSSSASVEALRRELFDEDISILINNAGIPGPVSDLVDINVEDWDEVFAINVRGLFLMCKAFLPQMIEQHKGDIINLASVTGKRPLARRTPYSASKMAVIGLTVTLAHEVGPLGVAVNSLSPGPVEGPRMVRNFALEAERTGTNIEQAERDFVSRSALKRMVTEAEVAFAAAAMLEMPGLCGADIDLSAGMIAR